MIGGRAGMVMVVRLPARGARKRTFGLDAGPKDFDVMACSAEVLAGVDLCLESQQGPIRKGKSILAQPTSILACHTLRHKLK